MNLIAKIAPCLIKTNIMKKIALFTMSMLMFINLSCNVNQPKNLDEPNKLFNNASEINSRLGKGINIGNTFEADQSWQSPFFIEDLKKIADLGFNHVRIPIKWEREDRGLQTPPYTLNKSFLEYMQGVVDEALKNELLVIINMHHHNELISDPMAHKERFLSQWQQLSDYFKDYPDSLLFEILNEPHDNFTSEIWNDFSKEALSVIRKTNPERCVLIGTANWGGVGSLSSLEIPNDTNIILTIHYYNPFQFTHQGASWSDGSDAWLGTEWRDTELERQAVMDDFMLALNLAKEKNIPIHVGEFGAYSRADIDSRVRWTLFLSRWFEQQGFSWAYWEWNSGFGIYNPKTGEYNQKLVDALVSDDMPEPSL